MNTKINYLVKSNNNKTIAIVTIKNSDLVAKLIKVRTDNALRMCNKNRWLEPIVRKNRQIRAKFNKIMVYRDKLNEINIFEQIRIIHFKN